MDIFGEILSKANSLFGQSLSDYLWGFNCSTEAYDLDSLYNLFGQISFWSSIAAAIIFYILYAPVRRQRIMWFLFCFLCFLINLIISFSVLKYNMDNGLIGNCLLYNEEGTQIIRMTNIINFSIVNGFFAVCVYFISSMVTKWFSKTCKHYPF